jgi:hypothetical protein
MKKVFCLALTTLAACGGAKPVPGGGPSDSTPQWVRQGTGAFNTEGGKRFQGVGVATGMRDPKTRRQASDAKAKEQLAQTMDALYQQLTRMSESTKENLADEITAIGKRANIQAAEVRDHWVTADGTESSLDVLELAVFKQALQKVDGDDKVKREMANNADRAFDQLSK